VKNCDRGLENAARERRPRTAFSSPRSQFFTIRTSQPANNIYLLFSYVDFCSDSLLNSIKRNFPHLDFSVTTIMHAVFFFLGVKTYFHKFLSFKCFFIYVYIFIYLHVFTSTVFTSYKFCKYKVLQVCLQIQYLHSYKSGSTSACYLKCFKRGSVFSYSIMKDVLFCI